MTRNLKRHIANKFVLTCEPQQPKATVGSGLLRGRTAEDVGP